MRPAVLALVGTVVDGEGAMGGRGLRGRAAGVNMFEVRVMLGIFASFVGSLTLP
jgi:hypothetical protein